MKVEVKKPVNPVFITLETQDEIDKFFGLLNFTPIVELDPMFNELWTRLYEDVQHEKEYYEKYRAYIKKWCKGR